ncbi:alanine:cation symporter family protein [Muricauda oceani]|uniref:Alanine:cation symporter family protein n=1 Tax=Flagellimonas oceani TaxID=2698672 RepID=A0A6G7IY87_9FLAO|nr:alanine/glycine:cation symporter family protein [Allomuricauda oceani]MBW8243879.1 alanine:cation symporter family protein [Allomuricauda oceani]QII43516.1 alanine:cation symporter family protein [Allomuricauda oceani]
MVNLLYDNTLAIFSLLHTGTTSNQGLDEKINDAFMPFAVWWENLILAEIPMFGQGIPLILIILIGGALFFTIYFGFVNVRHFPTAIQVVRGKYDELEKNPPKSKPQVYEVDGDLVDTIKDEGHLGEVNHFQALATAVSGTVGLGNIAMVAVAISIGGPGATFWMILAGLLGMSTKFVECTLGVKYRDIDKEGNVFGGPMYYLSKGIAQKGFSKLGKILAGLFAILCVGASFGGGNAFQSNQAAAQIIERFGLTGNATGSIIGAVFAILAGIVIIGGIKRIAKVTEKVVPFMAVLYVGAALFIIFSKIEWVDDAFALIFKSAFTPEATVSGGFVGVMIQGFRRAAFSNEAGAGSAAIAHSAVNTGYPASEGLVGLLEPFIDTVLVCTMTAIVIILFNMDGVFAYGNVIEGQALLNDGSRLGGVNITSMAFESSINGSSWILMLAVCLFAFSTILSWSYYGLQAWKYLFGRSRVMDLTYKIVYLMFTVLGAAITLDAVIKFSDAMILALVFPNMIGLLILFPYVKKEFINYKELIFKKQN